MAKGVKETAIIAGLGLGGLICVGVSLTLLAVLANVGMLGFLVNHETKENCPDCVCGGPATLGESDQDLLGLISIMANQSTPCAKECLGNVCMAIPNSGNNPPPQACICGASMQAKVNYVNCCVNNCRFEVPPEVCAIPC